MDRTIFYILFFIGIICLLIYILNEIINLRRAKKYGRISSNLFLDRYYEKLGNILLRQKLICDFNEQLAYKISIFNTASFEKNKKIAFFVILSYGILLTILSSIMFIIFLPYWYISCMYIIFVNMAAYLIMLLVIDAIMNNSIKRLPETIKILQSRFLSKGNIAKAIHVSIVDLPKGMKSEMIRIYDALKQNEMYKAKETFREIDKKYSNEHMSILLDLIWLAHYNGGDETIKGQFESMLNDVLEDIENQQDLKGAAMSYIIMSLLFILALPLVRIYNQTILTDEEMKYYFTKEGMIFAALYVALLFALMGIIFYLKKGKV